MEHESQQKKEISQIGASGSTKEPTSKNQ